MSTYFVSTTGNDSNPGTQASPFLTVRNGVSLLNPGDTLLIRGGIYREDIRTGTTTIRTGNSSAHITLSGYLSENPTLAPTVAGIDFSYCTGIAYWDFSNFIINASIAGSETVTLGAYLGSSVNNITFTSVEVIGLYAPSSIGNTTINALGFQGAGAFITVKNCLIHHMLGYAFYVAGQNWTFDGCSMYDNGGYGGQFYHSASNDVNNNTIKNCRVYNNGFNFNETTGGVALTSGSNNIAYNNVVYRNNGYGLQTASLNGGTNTRLYNNTVYTNNQQGIYIFASGGTGTIVRNNISYNNGLENIRDDSGIATIDHNFTSDPNFVDPTTNDYRLQSTSGAINFGVDLSSVFTTDYLGNTRSLPFDAGAYEFGVIILPPISCDMSLPWTLITSGVFTPNTLVKNITFNIRPARWICLRSLSEINGGPWASCAEFTGLVNGISLLQTKATLLAWDYVQGVDPAVKFRIYRQVGGTGTFGLLAEVLYPETTYLDSAIIQGVVYTYDVTAVDIQGVESTMTNTAQNVASTILSHSVWCVTSEEIVSEDGRGIHAIDGITTTFWHTQYSPTLAIQPHNIVVDLGTTYSLNGFTYLPRQDGGVNGTISQYEFYIADYFIPTGRHMRSAIMQPFL